MKKLFTTILMVCSIQIINAQKIQTYSGVFEDGNAIYNYYENENYERIYHGKFNYDNGTVVGYFKNDKRDSIWLFTDKGVNNKINYKLTIKGRYKSGKIDGAWTYKKVDAATNKVLQASSITFIDGIMTGDYEYSDSRIVTQNGIESQIIIKGKFDKDGFYDGDWLIKYTMDKIPYEIILKYRNGFRYLSIFRNLATGEVNKTDNSPDLELINRLAEKLESKVWDNSRGDKNTKYFNIQFEGKDVSFGESVDNDSRLNWEYAYCFWNYFYEQKNELFKYNFIKGQELETAFQNRFLIKPLVYN